MGPIVEFIFEHDRFKLTKDRRHVGGFNWTDERLAIGADIG